jgi:hypothetical protein
MAKSRFKITEFTNRTGTIAYRVSGTLDGNTIRKNFKTRTEASDYRQKLDIEFLNGGSKGQTVWTTLTHEENRDAIAAIHMLKKAKASKSLTFAVGHYLRTYREHAEDITVAIAAASYTAEKQKEKERGMITELQARCIRAELERFTEFFGTRVLGELRSPEIRDYLETTSRPGRGSKIPSLKTWNNRRGYLSTFFKYCLFHEYITHNPILSVPQFKIAKARGTAETLSAQQVADLMLDLETYRGQESPVAGWWGKPGCLVPYFALTLFAGIRPDWQTGEIGRVLPGHIRFDTDIILIEPSVSKINEKRTIKLQPNLRLWLERYPIKTFPIIPGRRFSAMLRDIRKRHNLGHDVLRHTYISMLVGAFRSVGDAALQAGNSEAVIRKHYLDLKSVEEADRFWAITPTGTSLPEKMEKKDGRYSIPEAAPQKPNT